MKKSTDLPHDAENHLLKWIMDSLPDIATEDERALFRALIIETALQRHESCGDCPHHRHPACYFAPDPAPILTLASCPLNRWPAALCRSEYFVSPRFSISLLPGKQKPTRSGLGDRLSSALASVGANRLTAAFTRLTGKDCGCKKRQELLNKLHAAIQRKP